MLASCGLNNPTLLWNEHKDSMTEDILYQARLCNITLNMQPSDALYNQTLIILEDKLQLMNGQNLSHYGLPEPNRGFTDVMNKDVLRETTYDIQQLEQYIKDNTEC